MGDTRDPIEDWTLAVCDPWDYEQAAPPRPVRRGRLMLAAGLAVVGLLVANGLAGPYSPGATTASFAPDGRLGDGTVLAGLAANPPLAPRE